MYFMFVLVIVFQFLGKKEEIWNRLKDGLLKASGRPKVKKEKVKEEPKVKKEKEEEEEEEF